MAHRVSATDDEDFYPTPPWAGRALCSELTRWFDLRRYWCWEPAAGRGDLALGLIGAFDEVCLSDIRPRTHPRFLMRAEELDFLQAERPPRPDVERGWIITNPPFNRAEEFVSRAHALGFRRMAFLVQLRWLESGRRYLSIFARDLRPDLVLLFAERVPMLKGRLSRRASTATAYCWVVWAPELRGDLCQIDWIPPGTRRQLEMAGDYDDDRLQPVPEDVRRV